jgi:hypothetical protein
MRILYISLLLTAFLSLYAQPALAGYAIGFSSDHIRVLSPCANGLECQGELLLAGTSDLSQVWFCLRGPRGELVTYPAAVEDGRFARTVALRFGPGTYTVWAGDNRSRFDGVIRFEVTNLLQQDVRELAPSACVDSDHPAIQQLAASLVTDGMSETERLMAIHDWVAAHIAYDYDAYASGQDCLVPASQTLEERTGTCGNYSFLVAALARALRMPARVVYGQVCCNSAWGSAPQLHAWNQVYADGRWVTLDATWDAGYIRDGRFVAAPSDRYFDPSPEFFAQTHSAASVTLH